MRHALPVLLLTLALAATTASAQQAPCVDGLAQLGAQSFPCDNVDLDALVPLAAMGAGEGNDVWGWTDPETGREYALMGLDDGTFFVDVTEPSVPLLLGKLPTTTVVSIWRDMKVYQDHAFVVADAAGAHGMQVFDLTRLRGLLPDPARLFTADAVFHGDGQHVLGSAHNVAINEETGFAYVVGTQRPTGGFVCAGGLYIVDVREPQNPRFAGCFAEDGYTHDAQCVVYRGPDERYAGREICFASNEDTVTIVDVTDKASPVLLSQGIYPNTAYTHQGWLTEDHAVFFVNDELDEMRYDLNTRTLVFDVSDLEAPEFTGTFVHPTTSITHNLFVRDRYLFASNYTTGLRILDLGGMEDAYDVDAITTHGYFDTYPQGHQQEFEGQWSNYPYFASGTVLASDINRGLFVLRPTNLAASGEPGPTRAAASLDVYPNPFADHATVALTLEEPQHVRVEVVDALGRQVALLHDGPVRSGATFSFGARALPAGVYFVRASGERFDLSRPLTHAP